MQLDMLLYNIILYKEAVQFLTIMKQIIPVFTVVLKFH